MNTQRTQRTTVKELRQAIRKKCLDCSGWQPKEVRLCTVWRCDLYPYRMGKKTPLVERPDSVQKPMLPNTEKTENPVTPEDGAGLGLCSKNMSPKKKNQGNGKSPGPWYQPRLPKPSTTSQRKANSTIDFPEPDQEGVKS